SRGHGRCPTGPVEPIRRGGSGTRSNGSPNGKPSRRHGGPFDVYGHVWSVDSSEVGLVLGRGRGRGQAEANRGYSRSVGVDDKALRLPAPAPPERARCTRRSRTSSAAEASGSLLDACAACCLGEWKTKMRRVGVEAGLESGQKSITTISEQTQQLGINRFCETSLTSKRHLNRFSTNDPSLVLSTPSEGVVYTNWVPRQLSRSSLIPFRRDCRLDLAPPPLITTRTRFMTEWNTSRRHIIAQINTHTHTHIQGE
ncbi:unnamed protein product, partial [Protopolystoma xenopodis]